MIQEAHVGVGIAGEEGRQAVMSADYAIGQFRYILLYNLAFTSLVIILMAAFDQDVDAKTSMEVPQLYKRGILQLDWSMKRFWIYILNGFYQSIVCFYLPYFLFHKGTFVTMSGINLNGIEDIGVFIAAPVIMVVNISILMDQQHWDWLFMLIWGLSILLFWLWTGTYSQSTVTLEFYKIAAHVFSTPSFWIVFFLTIIVAIFPQLTIKSIQKIFYPDDIDIIREQRHLGSQPNGATYAAPGNPKAAIIQAQIDDTVGIMKENITKVAQRGDRLHSLQDKTESLATSAQGFRRGANRVRKQMWWKDVKMHICLIIGMVFSIT
ncbi:hypothetical protein PMAC_000868 [Pneumocystis sp. 'macacae']|nr:hypothetical protein PMAC_000868 [Pneumocystis sp. 'macacae']